MRHTSVLGAIIACAAIPALADPIPAELQGRWSDAECHASVPVLLLTGTTFEVLQAGRSVGSLMVDAQGAAAERVDLRVTRIITQSGGSDLHLGDVIAVRLLDGNQLLFIERVMAGRHLPINDKPLSRCGP